MPKRTVVRKTTRRPTTTTNTRSRPKRNEDWNFDGQTQPHRHTTAEPWVEVKDSEALAALSPPVTGQGLFAARRFRRGELVGRFVGKILPKQIGYQLAQNNDISGRYVIALQLGRPARTYTIDSLRPLQTDSEQIHEFGQVLMPHGRFARHMRAEKINDVRGTRLPQNVDVDTRGWVWAIKNIRPGQELLWTYGDGYWNGRS